MRTNSTNKLGAFGSDLRTIAYFFDKPWNDVSRKTTANEQAWLLNEAAFALRALGRMYESLVPTRACVDLSVQLGDWRNAAIYLSNQSELEQLMGALSEADDHSEQSVTYADKGGDVFWMIGTRGIHADALHQLGRWSDAESLFCEAEQMQAEYQPSCPLLYSLPGFRYCDLLLAPAERHAWRKDGGGRMKDEWIEACRAAQTVKWAEQNNKALLDITINHLTLARAALYESILSADSSSSFILPPASFFDSAVSGLRSAGQQIMLPRALLTRAWHRSLRGKWTGADSAQSDLDEAWKIASRGPMPLFMADIHLSRARLFGTMKDEG